MFTKFEGIALAVGAMGVALLAVGNGKPLGIFVSPPLFWGGIMSCIISMHRRGYVKARK